MTVTNPEGKRAQQASRVVIREFVESQVIRLQEGYVREQATSASKAALAKLRRGVGKLPTACPELAEFYINPDVEARSDEPTDHEWAAHVALGLYATHQQSQTTRMHVKDFPFGVAVGRIARGDKDSKELKPGVLRRFQAMATAADFLELSRHARGLIQLLRQHDQGFDYGVFAADLADFRHPSKRDSVRLRWGRHFYSRRADATSVTESTTDTEHGE